MFVAALIFAALAALLHVYIFALETLLWQTARARTVFGMSEAEAAATKQLAFNQGFYNLFLAVTLVAGIVASIVNAPMIADALLVTGAASMLAAAIVLFASDSTKRRPALTQALFPLLSLVFLFLAGLE